MKRKKISIFVLLTIVLLLSSCDVTTMFETMRGNTYEDIFGVDLVGDQVNETVNTVSNSSTPVEADENSYAGVGADADKVDVKKVTTIEQPKGVSPPLLKKSTDGARTKDKIAVKDGKIPTLPKQTKEEKTVLKSAVASSLSGSSKKDFIEKLKTPATPDKALAAHNTSVMVTKLLESLESDLGDSEDGSTGKQIQDITKEIKNTLILPDNPTEADILNVQMASNLVNSLTSTLNLIAGDDGTVAGITSVNMEGAGVKDGLLEVVSDAAFMVNVSRAQGTNSELVNSIDIDGLLGMLGDQSGASSEYALDDETVDYLNSFKATINLVLEDVLGVDTSANKPKMDTDKFDAAIANYSFEYSAYQAFITAIKLGVGGLKYSDLDSDEVALFTGISGLLNYTLSNVLINVQPAFDKISGKIGNDDFDTIKEIVDALLDSNADLVGASEYTAGMEFTLPVGFDSLGTAFDNPDKILKELALEEKAEKFIENAIILYEFGLDGGKDLILEMLKEAQASFNDDSSQE